MQYTIQRRYSWLTPITVEIGAEFEASPEGVKLGAAVKVAFKSGAVLSGADLSGANLRGANLSGAVLSGADLSGANLRGANLRGAVLSGADLSDADLSDADLSGAVLSGADLSDADLSGADLSDAVLSGADLRGADLSDAVLSGADLSDAVLSGADLRGADLSDAVLSGAVLSDAVLSGVPKIPNIDAAILAAIEAGGKLEMNTWHTCETTHCRAGWAITLAGDAGRALEFALGSAAAGALIYAASDPDRPIPDFYASNEDALADLKVRAAAQERA